MTSKYKSLPTQISIFKEGDSPIFGESATIARIDDEGGGPFLRIEQDTDDQPTQVLQFDFDEFQFFVQEVNKLLSHYSDEK